MEDQGPGIHDISFHSPEGTHVLEQTDELGETDVDREEKQERNDNGDHSPRRSHN